MLNLTTNGSDWLEDKSLAEMTLDELAREGAKRMITEALILEVAEYIEAMRHLRDECGRALVTRNGLARSRKVTLGSGTIELAGPRVRDRSGEKFTSSILPPYVRRSPKAVECLLKDTDTLTTHFAFPGEHWIHIRSTNPIESTFATVKLRTRVTKGAGSRTAGLAMAFKLLESAEKRWRRIRAPHLVMKVREGVVFKDGIELTRLEGRVVA